LTLVTTVRIVGEILLGVAAAYPLVAIAAVWVRHRFKRHYVQASPSHAITVLKPLCGSEPRLYENLRSFCEQDGAGFQIVFGTLHADDPALIVARRLQSELQHLDIVVVADERVHGSNLKVSNLINLLAHAKHDLVVLADSDIRVPRDYLRRVTAPLAQPDVGVVTCLYRGTAVGGVWSRLGAQFVNDWFAPSVSVAALFGSTFAFGATIAMRRCTLDAIGGFKAVADHLADDYRLGELAHQRGLRVVISECEVSSDVFERRARDLFAHELRWLHTIRSVEAAGYLGSFVTFTIPVAAAGLALAGTSALAIGLFSTAAMARLVLHFQSAFRPASLPRDRGRLADLGLVLVRDWLSLVLWAVALTERKVSLRGRRFKVGAEGSVHLIAEGSS
jgi:ceramide glucosyltransferase